jgi:hypothetical protein
MNFNNISVTQLTAWIAIPLGLMFAAWAGMLVAEGQTVFLLAILGGIVAAAIGLGMGRNIWLLIPLTWPLTGNIGFLPLPFSVQEVGAMGAFLGFCLLAATRRVAMPKVKPEWLDFLIAINLGLIALMYVRNPVGFAVLGGDTVGGRPYLLVATAVMTLIVLSRTVVPAKTAYWLPIILLVPKGIAGLLGFITQIFPALAPVIAPIYSGINVGAYVREEYLGGAPGEGEKSRFSSLADPGTATISALFAYKNPTKVMSPEYPLLFAAFLCGIAMVFASGFRNQFVAIGFFVLFASYRWGGGIAVARALVLVLVGLLLLVSIQAVRPLPFSVQRAISFIPGPWDEEVRLETSRSTDWRVEMWKIALTTDRYITDKVWGDGFGFTAQELNIMKSAGLGGQGFIGDTGQEAFMIQGSYHSGPVSSIRFVGYVGLFLFLALRIAMIPYAMRVLRSAWGTPYQPMAMLLAMWCAYAPFGFIFVFGEYRNDLPNALFECGMLKMLHNSLLAQRATAKPKDAADTVEQSIPLPPIHRPAVVGAHYVRH